MKGVKIANITYDQVETMVNEKTIVVLPIGGGSKEHGGHLPMGTDYFVTDWVANKVVESYPVVCLPTLPYAYFPAFVNWKGSVSVDYQNFINFVKDILLSFVKFGVKKYLIIDGGVSTHMPLRLLALTMMNEHEVTVGVTNIRGLAKEAEEEVCRQKSGGHGDEGETSCMLYINEKLVHMDKTVEEYSESIKGCFKNGALRVYVPGRMDTPRGTNGNSTLASKEKGDRILNAMADDILEFLKEFDKIDG